jgi:hypothetical protein
MIKQAILITLVAGSLAALVFAVSTDKRAPESESAVARGKYLVTAFGCSDCHTPFKLGPQGPEPDMARQFAGHPEELAMPPAPALPPGPWMISVSGTNTAWAGPWGVSFTANLTPDAETGLGKWTEHDFIDTVRSGRHLGRGREILPPMPVPALRNLTDSDLSDVFAYLKSLPPIKNHVPDPRPPSMAR